LYFVVTRDIGSGTYFQVYNGTQNNFTDTGLLSGYTYNYRVKAFNAIGFALESNIISAIAGSLPSKITTLSIEL